MTEFTFYQVLEATPAAVDATLPKLLEKAVAGAMTTTVICPNQSRAARVDESLWSYTPTSFLAHNMVGEGAAPVLIGVDTAATCDIALFLSGAGGETPQIEDFANFKRVIYLFEGSDIQKTKARRVWKQLKAQNATLSYFQHNGTKWAKVA